MEDGTNRTLKKTLSKWILETDCSRVDLLPTALLTQDDPTVPWLFSVQNCAWEAPSHSKTGVNKFASGKGEQDFTADGTG